MSTTEQSIPITRIVGDGAQVVTVGRDLNVYEMARDEAEEFFEVALGHLQEAAVPPRVGELAELARRVRVLVLGGRYEDKATVARLIARDLARDEGGDAPRPVLERSRISDYHSLLRALERRKEPAVFLMNAVLPQHVGYDLNRLRDAVEPAGHLVLITTGQPRAAWKIPEHADMFWYELEAEELFDAETLVAEMVRHVRGCLGDLPPGVFVEAFEPDRSTLAGIELRELAVRLGSPVNIEFFLRQLCAPGSGTGVGRDAVEELVSVATSGDRRVERWFHTELEPDEQLLALSLTFFDGLFDDQYFAALEQWVAHIREHRNPAQRAFDYADLDRLQTYFSPVESETTGIRFGARDADGRRQVIQAAWRSHRRQILGALPVLTELVVDSVESRGDDVELYGDSERRDGLRRAVGDALSDVGLRSVSSVQPALLRLASDGDPDVQWVAARAVAKWRERGADDQLFRLLARWQEDTRLRAVVLALLEGRKEEEEASPLAYVRATIALAVAEAAGYDAPNALTPPLVQLLKQLADDDNQLVRSRFARFTLPWVASLHLRQLREVLYEMTRYVDLTQAIGASLAYAYQTHPRDVLETLDDWHARAQRARAASIHPERIEVRDAVLMTLAFTYGEIAYDEDRTGVITAETGFGRLKKMLGEEAHPKVRTAVVMAISRQASQRFAQVEPLLQRLVGEVTEDERVEIVRVLQILYLEQRRGLKGCGSVKMKMEQYWYPVWVDAPRPSTEVEKAMIRWIKDAGNPAAQRIAMQASLAFAAALDEEESRWSQRHRHDRQRRAEADAAARVANAPARAAAAGPGWYTGTFVPWLATMGSGEYYAVIRGLLPEALAQSAARRPTLDFVLDKWRRMQNDTEAPRIAALLRSAVDMHAYAWLLLAVGGVFALILLAVVF